MASKNSEPKVVALDREDKKTVPCIDFQPDDRWQIKEEKSTDSVKNNSKIKAVKNNSSEKVGRRLRSSRSNDSAVNGEAVSSSGDEMKSKPDDENCGRKLRDRNTSELNDQYNHRSLRRKRSSARTTSSDNNVVETKRKKRGELTTVEIHEVIEESNEAPDKKNEIIVEVDDDDDDDSSDKNMPNLSPAAQESDDVHSIDRNLHDTEDGDVEMDKPDDTQSETSEQSQENKDDGLPKLDEFKKADTNQEENDSKQEDDSSKQEASSSMQEASSSKQEDNDAKQETADSKIDGEKSSDVEVINISEETKKSEASDEESDSEVQVINSTEDDTPPSTELFPSVTELSVDLLTAGYPFYNSLKEKISGFKAGEYKPVKFPHTGTLVLDDQEVIIESPSLLVPLLIKESDQFPKLDDEEKKANGEDAAVAKPMVISKRNFFQSSVGQFLINLGMSRVQEWYHRDMKKSKLRQAKSPAGSADKKLQELVELHTNKHAELKQINAAFNFRMRRCQFCGFRSESRTVMEGHYLTPHISPRREFKCNFCDFFTRDSKDIVFHYEAMHGKKAVLEFNLNFHECIFCSFQSHLKTKVSAHMNRCRKHFIPSQNLAPPFDFEFPGVTTKPVTIADVFAHRRLLMNAPKNRLPLPDDNSPQAAYARKKLQSVLTRLSSQGTYPDLKNPSIMKHLMTSQAQLPALASGGIQLPPGIVITRPRNTLPQMRQVGRFPQPRAITGIRTATPRGRSVYTGTITTAAATQLASSGISITPVTKAVAGPSRANTPTGMKNVTLTPISTATNRNVSQKPGPPQPVALFTNVAGSSGVPQPAARLPLGTNVRNARPVAPYQRLNTPPSQVVKGSSGNTFVMCEICDSYIKDLEELRSHMNWVHKVKIHPKMLVSRPPLNCQKCHWRFFTDQGLERHLLGAHGLVTTNMQEMANKNQDGGRCIICGAVFTYKLVSHMTQVHKVTLKPAHLSYKCTVCTATFTLYRLFESHVYNVHSGSAKRPADETAVSEPPAKKPATETKREIGPRKCRECGLITENFHNHVIKSHMKKCSVKLCRIEKCQKCLYSSDEMLVIRMSDFGISEDLDDSDEDSSEEDDSDSSSNSGENNDCDVVVHRLSKKQLKEQDGKSSDSSDD